MTWDPKDLVAATGAQAAAARRGGDVQGYLTATVQVSQPHYVPSGVRVRVRVSPTAFEGVMPASQLERVRSDGKVEAVTGVRHEELGW
jgi:hypothetical protein